MYHLLCGEAVKHHTPYVESLTCSVLPLAEGRDIYE